MSDFDTLIDRNQNNESPSATKTLPLYIEGDDGELIDVTATPTKNNQDLPQDATQCSTSPGDIAESLFYLKDNIAVIATQVKQALEEHQPEEWGVEFNVGFKAEGGIPFIAKGEANSALKITAKWKKSEA